MMAPLGSLKNCHNLLVWQGQLRYNKKAQNVPSTPAQMFYFTFIASDSSCCCGVEVHGQGAVQLIDDDGNDYLSADSNFF